MNLVLRIYSLVYQLEITNSYSKKQFRPSITGQYVMHKLFLFSPSDIKNRLDIEEALNFFWKNGLKKLIFNEI